MSMLGEQIKELRKAAFNIQGKLGRCRYRRKDVDEMQQISGMLFEAADTIESLLMFESADIIENLRDRLQDKPVWRCDCGAFMTQYIDVTTYHKPRFCPKCGEAMKL